MGPYGVPSAGGGPVTDPLLCGLCVGLCLGMTAAIGLMALARWREDRERLALHTCPFCHSFLCVETVREDVSPALSAYGLERWRVVCYNCGAIGPDACDKREAERVWYKWP